jgi:photosystem II stability/assembly factor-like uncharacterized protein
MKIGTVLLVAGVSFAQSWIPQSSNTTASLRGVSAVDERVVWASGSGGTWLRTIDGGATWHSGKVPGAESLDFRGIRAFDARTAYLMSSGSGDKSRIYFTKDGGAQWKLLFSNAEPKGFFDSIAFWDQAHGVVVGDVVEGGADILTTADGGVTWERQKTPIALPGEGSFAASNTCLFVRGPSEAWYVTGGSGAGRVFHSVDQGRTWTGITTPIRNDSASAGIFSIAFGAGGVGMIVGGDYAKDKENQANIAITTNGGGSWTAPSERPGGFRSAVAWIASRKMWIVTGTSGSDISIDEGRTWRTFDTGSYNALSFASDGTGWAVGARGRIARFSPSAR